MPGNAKTTSIQWSLPLLVVNGLSLMCVESLTP